MADSPAIEAFEAQLRQRINFGYKCGFALGVHECIITLGWEKFGQIDPETYEALKNKMDGALLQVLFKRLITATTWQEIFEPKET
jgi:hypothetical protein